MIKFSILSENRDCGVFRGEGGLSLLVNTDKDCFLLDTGYSNLFLQNAKLLDIDLSKIDTVVLTHGHSDHSNGLKFLEDKKTIILHPMAFKDRWSIRKKEYVGLPMTETQLKSRHNVIETTEPYQICNNCFFLGQIPMTVDFEKNGNFSTCLDEGLTQTDYTEDDSGIAIKTTKGLVIATGCGHRGICNTIEHAKKITGQTNVYAVLGGFHLRKLEKQKEIIDKTINYIIENNIKELYLGHCVTDDVIDYFEQNLPNVKIHRLSAGKVFEIN